MDPTYPHPGYPIGINTNATTDLGRHLPPEEDYTDAGVYPDPEQVGIGLHEFPLSGFLHADGALGGNDLAPDPSATDTSTIGTTEEPAVNPPINDPAGGLILLPPDEEDGNNGGTGDIMCQVVEMAHESGGPAPVDVSMGGQSDGITEEIPERERVWDEFEYTLAQLVPKWARDDEDEEMEG